MAFVFMVMIRYQKPNSVFDGPLLSDDGGSRMLRAGIRIGMGRLAEGKAEERNGALGCYCLVMIPHSFFEIPMEIPFLISL
jgi:hypothetical protein